MNLCLRQLPPVRGIYGAAGVMPDRALWIHPDAYASFMNITHTFDVVFSDIFRNANGSLEARKIKRGVQRPAYSGHNYGLSFDIDIDQTKHRTKASYQEILELLAGNGWFCHRRDGASGEGQSESWHFNCLGPIASLWLATADVSDHSSWSRPIEELIRHYYEKDFYLPPQQIQIALHKAKDYDGEIDGKLGPLTRSAIEKFQRAWMIQESGAGPITQRTLAYVTADVVRQG